MAELADAADSKSAEVHPSWGFNSPSRHQPNSLVFKQLRCVALTFLPCSAFGNFFGCFVYSEGAELLAVGQEEAEVLPRQGHQLQRYRDAGLRHVVLQSAGR